MCSARVSAITSSMSTQMRSTPAPLGAGLIGFWDAGSCGGSVFGLRRFGRGSHGRVPIKKPAATVAGEHFTLAKLVPHLRADAHAASGALLVVDASKAGATGTGEPVKANEPLG